MKLNHQQNSATPEEIWKILREASKFQKETKQILKETAQQMKETDRKIEETTKQIKKTEALFNSQWGKLVESLVEGKLLELLQSRSIDVSETGLRIKGSCKNETGKIERREIDIIAANGKEVVAVEVKTTLKPDDVKEFVETLKIFGRCFPRYKNETVYGAVAYLRSDAKAPLFAERQGLLVIRATGDSASLINQPDFKPRIF